jgi:hypothetical protein
MILGYLPVYISTPCPVSLYPVDIINGAWQFFNHAIFSAHIGAILMYHAMEIATIKEYTAKIIRDNESFRLTYRKMLSILLERTLEPCKLLIIHLKATTTIRLTKT